jgi:hypothetical protein
MGIKARILLKTWLKSVGVFRVNCGHAQTEECRGWVDVSLVSYLGKPGFKSRCRAGCPKWECCGFVQPCRKMPTRHLKLRHDHIVVLSSSVSVTVPCNRNTYDSIPSNPKAALSFNIGVTLYCLMIIQIFHLLRKQVPFLTDTDQDQNIFCACANGFVFHGKAISLGNSQPLLKLCCYYCVLL